MNINAPSIVAFSPLYYRFTAVLQLDSKGLRGCGAEPLSLSNRNCPIRRSGGAQ
ncbi:MAG: hypothetical protein K9M08_01775 [Pirellula sp.]|nr:hypothetical protein [Pirellula sp.]